jgi:predicted transcriptional regulator
LRRKLRQPRAILDKKLATSASTTPVTIEADSLLNEAVKVFKSKALDSIIVVDGKKPVGVLDVQDLIKLGLLGQEHL